jgi:processing peptidase subunit alpha
VLKFQSTLNRSRDDAFSLIERHGGLIDCQSTKDTFVYASSCHVDGMDDVLGVIADAVLRANITDEEVCSSISVLLIANCSFSDGNCAIDCAI